MTTSPLPTTPTSSAERPRMPLRRKVAALSTAAVLMLASACGASDGTATTSTAVGSQSSVSASSLTANTVGVADTHADANDGDYSPDGATTITLADGASTVDGTGAHVEGDVVTITKAGTYLVSGTLTDGQLVVDSTGDGKVVLVLDGVDLTSADTSPVVITEADEAVLVLADGSTNVLADSAASGDDDKEDDAPTATLFSMADLTIAGSGSLRVTGTSNDAIVAKDGLVILSGTIDVTAADDGIRGKDYLVVQGGTLSVESGGDGLKSDNEDVGELGWVQIDAGTVTIAAGDDGVDAVGAINVADGTLVVTESEEGLEAAAITIAGGAVEVTANDDGLNATDASSAGESAQDGVLITISGGDVAVTTGADGLDSNGSAIITGGTTVVSSTAPGGGDGSLDVNGTLAVNSGTLAALGGISRSPATDSEQGFVAVSLDTAVEAGQQVAVVDSGGEVVARYVVEDPTSAVIVAADGIVNGDSYDVVAGDAGGQTGFSTGGSTAGLTTIGTATAGESTGGDMGPRGSGPGDWGGAPGERPDPGIPPGSTEQS
jgi:hypothetical protein